MIARDMAQDAVRKWPTSPSSPVDGAPPLTAAAIEEARRNPNGWVYAIDGVADPNGAVPPERVRGAWKVNARGEIEGGFIPNPNYRPVGR